MPDDLLGLAPVQPSVFLPNIVSETNRYEYGSVFNHDNTELYFGVQNNGWSDIRMMHRTKEGWSKPQVIIGSPDFSANDPFLSNDGSKLYFISPRDDQYDIGYVTRTADGRWSNPIFPSMPINSTENEYYISFTQDGSMVFASDRNASERGDFDIYLSRRDDTGFQAAVAFPNTINTNGYEADAFIAPDESYMIFSANRKQGLGRGDLYISFALEDGNWSKAVSMGAQINSESHELCPFVTADGQYFFFTSKEDIYWVNADIIESFRPVDGNTP
ncbi:MAG: PD40 domain-containing protein [Robiginitomaculum sp.]|nr:PD40 domain-containing protein [Robiginitomaculum sp.]